MIKFREDLGLKTNKEGLKHRKLSPKEVSVYAIPGLSHCPVMVIKKYLSLLPPNRKSREFYLQPKKKFTPSIWFEDRHVGKNKLQKMVHQISETAGFPGFYSNHSLRATATT